MTTTVAALGTDFYVPAHEVWVGGQRLDRQTEGDILSVTYTDSLDGVDSFTLELDNWNPKTRTLKYSEGKRFEPGTRLELRMGYLRNTLPMCKGEITSLQPRFPASGAPTLSVSGFSVLHDLREKKRSMEWREVTDREIAQQIVGRVGLDIQVDGRGADERHDYLLQDNQEDIDFLLGRARAIGYELTQQVREDGKLFVHYAPRCAARRLSFGLEWGRSLLSFDPRISTADQAGAVTVRSAHPIEGRNIEVTVQRSGGGGSPYEGAYRERELVIANRPVKSEAEARKLATTTLRDMAWREVTASASTVGLPWLRAGVRVEISRLNARYLDATWYVTSSTHTLDGGGYTTSFEAAREVCP